MRLFLLLTRFFGVVPFVRFDPRGLLHSPGWIRLACLAGQATAAVIYLLYCVQSNSALYRKRAAGGADDKMTFTTLAAIVNVAVDQFNAWTIILISQRNPALVNRLLQNFHSADRMLRFDPTCWHQTRTALLTVATVFVCVAKNGYLMIYFDARMFGLSIGSRLVYGTILSLELLISLFCMEICSRMNFIARRLKTAGAVTDLRNLKSLHYAYKALHENGTLLASGVRNFLLFNVVQMFMLIMNGSLNVFVICVLTRDDDDFSVPWCMAHSFFAADCAWRLSFLARNCGLLQIEAEKIGDLVSRLMRHKQDHQIAIELQAFCDLALSRKLNFSACGLFDVDLPLLFAAGGAITSYIFLITQLK